MAVRLGRFFPTHSCLDIVWDGHIGTKLERLIGDVLNPVLLEMLL